MPEADFKFFITASAKTRALRRYKELKGLNNDLIFIDGSSFGSGLFIFQIEFTSSRLISGKFIRLAN